jgi:glycine/D-amino acid oxidase-like deaminating enzyme
MTDFFQKEYPKSYWLDVPIITGRTDIFPKKGSVVVIGSGLSGVSVGYFLNQQGFEDVIVLDYKPEQSASYRNAGHILYGTVESMKALSEIHGADKAKDIWSFSIQICNQVEETIKENEIEAEYKREA